MRLKIAILELEDMFSDLKHSYTTHMKTQRKANLRIFYQMYSSKHEALIDKLTIYHAHKMRQREHAARSRGIAILKGLEQGLLMYDLIVAAVFSLFVLSWVFGISLPPLLIVMSVTIGLLSLIVCGSQALLAYGQELCAMDAKYSSDDRLFENLLNDLKNQRFNPNTIDTNVLSSDSHRDQMKVFSFDTLRLGLLGIGRGPKAIQFLFGTWQDITDEPILHHSLMMNTLILCMTPLYAGILGYTTHAEQLLKKSSQVHNTNVFFPKIENDRIDSYQSAELMQKSCRCLI